MSFKKTMMILAGAVVTLSSCCNNQTEDKFKFLIDEFADVKIMRYQIPGWESLTLQQKEYLYFQRYSKYRCFCIWCITIYFI
jgi:dipeptidyl-peptidase-3